VKTVFESVLEKLDDYIDKMDAEKPSGFNLDLALEVRKRIAQLQHLFNGIDGKHLRYMELTLREHRRMESLRRELKITGPVNIEKSEAHLEMEELIFEIELWTESFYYVAGRMRTILTNGSKPLPGLDSFECVGARNVRNHLLEHPEGRSSGIFTQSFGVGGDQGPTLKIERETGQENIFPDAGLWANAEEIRKNIEALLDRVLA
jgi:hypothetical protein